MNNIGNNPFQLFCVFKTFSNDSEVHQFQLLR